MHLGWFSHKWTALSTGISTLRTSYRCIQVWSLKPYMLLSWDTKLHSVKNIKCKCVLQPHHKVTHPSEAPQASFFFSFVFTGLMYGQKHICNNRVQTHRMFYSCVDFFRDSKQKMTLSAKPKFAASGRGRAGGWVLLQKHKHVIYESKTNIFRW